MDRLVVSASLSLLVVAVIFAARAMGQWAQAEEARGLYWAIAAVGAVWLARRWAANQEEL